jgi:hypothetical protein
MAMNGTTNYGTPPVYGAPSYAGQPGAAAAPVPADMQALNSSIDMQLKSQMSRGAVPTSMPQSVSVAPQQTSAPKPAPANDPSTDPADQGNVSWALLMEMKQSSGQQMTPAETARYQGIMTRANNGAAPTTAPTTSQAPQSTDTDPANQGNVTWALVMEMKQASGQQMSPAEQARYQGIMARANQGQPTTNTTAPGGTTNTTNTTNTTMPTTLPTSNPSAPSQPDAGNAQPMGQAEYDSEVKWAMVFEKSDAAKRYNAFNKEKKIRSGQAEGSPAMTDQQFASESAWAQQFAQSPDIIRYKRIAGEVKRRQTAGERTRPTGLLDKVKNFFSGLIGRFTKKKDPQPQQQQQPAQTQGSGAPPTGQSAPAPTGA